MVNIFASRIRRSKEANEGASSLRELITNSKSPSITIEEILISKENSNALTAATTSTSTTERGRAIFWDIEAITIP